MTTAPMTDEDASNSPGACTGAPDCSYEILGRLRLASRLGARERAPELGADAFHGLVGEIVQEIAPLTEASPAAMLVTLLASFSAMAGRYSYVHVGAQRHYPLLFALVIGRTARDRKGTSAAAVRPVLDAADDPGAPFMRDRQIRGGLQSAEALIQAAASAGSTGALIDGREPDQRLLVVEEEYARLLVVASRQGSTLSPTLRSVWDGDVIAAHTKAATLKAEHPHVAIVGHVTMDELTFLLKATDVANGYANRFLHVLSRRTQLLSEPGRLSEDRIRYFGERLREVIAFSHIPREITRSPEFRREWDRLYRIVESQPSGGVMYDSLTARASPQLLRLALIFALLDQSPVLEVVHLRAAAALWEYCEASIAHIWGATLGDPKLDELLTATIAAGDDGLDRTTINRLFSNNLGKEQVDALVGALLSRGLVRRDRLNTGGRPREVIVALR